MEVISSIYNSGYNIKKFYLGSRELNLAYLGNQVIYDEVIGDNDLNYILYEFYGSDTLPNTVEAPVKSAILKGNTDENLQSVKMPVLTTTNGSANILIGSQLNDVTGEIETSPYGNKMIEDYILIPNADITMSSVQWLKVFFYDENKVYISNTGGDYIDSYVLNSSTIPTNAKYFRYHYSGSSYPVIRFSDGTDYITPTVGSESFKSNILTVNEDVTLRSNGDVYDELNLLTGRLTQRIDENNEVLAQEVVKTVDLTIMDQDGQTISVLNSFNGTTRVSTEVAENSTYPTVAIEVACELQTAMSEVAEDIELIKLIQNDIETTLDTQSNDIDSLLLATTELFEMFL